MKANSKTERTKSWPKPSLKELAKIHGLNLTKINWSQPMELKEIANDFAVHRNTMSQWLRDQVICNQQLSARRWRIAIYEFPDGHG